MTVRRKRDEEGHFNRSGSSGFLLQHPSASCPPSPITVSLPSIDNCSLSNITLALQQSGSPLIAEERSQTCTLPGASRRSSSSYYLSIQATPMLLLKVSCFTYQRGPDKDESLARELSFLGSFPVGPRHPPCAGDRYGRVYPERYEAVGRQD
jgi:hypothetical protein